MPPSGVACSVVVPAISACRSSSLLKVSQKCSQLIHMCFVSASPAGFRLEIGFKIDKKKMKKKNFIFHEPTKIFLTRKRNRRVRGKQKNYAAELLVTEAINHSHRHGPYSRFDRIDWCTQFFDLRNAIGMPTKCGRGTKNDELGSELHY